MREASAPLEDEVVEVEILGCFVCCEVENNKRMIVNDSVIPYGR